MLCRGYGSRVVGTAGMLFHGFVRKHLTLAELEELADENDISVGERYTSVAGAGAWRPHPGSYTTTPADFGQARAVSLRKPVTCSMRRGGHPSFPGARRYARAPRASTLRGRSD